MQLICLVRWLLLFPPTTVVFLSRCISIQRRTNILTLGLKAKLLTGVSQRKLNWIILSVVKVLEKIVLRLTARPSELFVLKTSHARLENVMRLDRTWFYIPYTRALESGANKNTYIFIFLKPQNTFHRIFKLSGIKSRCNFPGGLGQEAADLLNQSGRPQLRVTVFL